MSCQISVTLLVTALAVTVLVSLPILRMFKLYCKLVAEKEGKVEEYQSISTDDGGLTRFQRENLSKLMNRYYLQFEDYKINTLGNKLRGFLIAGYGLAILFVLLSIYVGTKICN